MDGVRGSGGGRVRGRGLAGGVLLAAVSTVLTILLCDAAIRRFRPDLVQETLLYRVPHPQWGWSLAPGASWTNRRVEPPVRVTYNSRGWRDLEREPAPAPGVTRIAVLGDSYMEAYSVELEEAFHRRLEALLESGGRRVEVLNFGVGGFGTLQEYMVWRDVVRAYRPDVVLLAFYLGNDLVNNSSELSPGRGMPLLDLSPGSEWHVPPWDYEAVERLYEARVRRAGRLRNRLVQASPLLGLAVRARARLRERLDGSDDSASAAGSVGGAPPIPGARNLGTNLCVEDPVWARAWTTTGRILERLAGEVRADGAELVVFSVPAKEEVDPVIVAALDGATTEFGTLCVEEAPAHRRLAALLDELGVPSVDLLPAFRGAVRGRGGMLFGDADWHWSAGGHALAADRVAEALVGWGLVGEEGQ